MVSKRCKKITAVDISKKMIDEAKKYCKSKNAYFIHADIMTIKMTGKFDRIYAVRSLEYVKNKDGFIKKMRGLLKEGGEIVIITKTTPCLWDMARKVTGFSQQKISHNKLSRLLKKHAFSGTIIKPVLIRLPIFANGNRELRLISERNERKALAYFKKLTILMQDNRVGALLTPFAESYLICAKKINYS